MVRLLDAGPGIVIDKSSVKREDVIPTPNSPTPRTRARSACARARTPTTCRSSARWSNTGAPSARRPGSRAWWPTWLAHPRAATPTRSRPSPARVDIVDVVGRHVELKRGGTNLMGLCPFHGEKSPSFSVSPAKQFYYCFGCGASGDAIRFLTEHLGLSFVEAVRDLAQQRRHAGARGTGQPRGARAPRHLRQRRLSLTEVLTGRRPSTAQQLKASPRGHRLPQAQRGLTGAIAARFGLGYAPPGWRRRWPACSRSTTTRCSRRPAWCASAGSAEDEADARVPTPSRDRSATTGSATA
jgi:hypothetical protein